jgi:ferric-dicitrate binding protein FerR (iron transport regulator)
MLKPYEKLVVNNYPALAANGNNADGLPDAEQPKADIELTRLSVMPQDNSIIETAWVNNRLVFRSETFEEVALKMERWYAVHIVFKDDKLKTKKLTGVFENETVDQALSAIQLTTPFSFVFTNEQITISK